MRREKPWTEWEMFAAQLQVAVLTFCNELRDRGVAVRRRGLEIQTLMLRRWVPARFDSAETENL